MKTPMKIRCWFNPLVKALTCALVVSHGWLAHAGDTLAAPPAPSSAPAGSPPAYGVPVPGIKTFSPNTAMDSITQEARRKFVQGSLASSPLSLRDMMNLFAHKIPAQPGVSYDDVVTSLKQRANKINFKFVGVNSIYKDVAALTGQPTPRVEVFNFCDALVARELLDHSLEFVVFLPCRIAVVEDAQGKVWLVTLDWDVSWLDTSPNPNRIPDGLKSAAQRIRAALEDIMQAGARGEL